MNFKDKLKKKNEKEFQTPVEGSKAKKVLGTLSATSIVLIIVIAILANILVTKGNWSYDVTSNKVFSISEESEKILDKLNQDITIYFLSSKKNVDDSYLQVAEQYVKKSKHVSIKYRDLELYPNFAKEYLAANETAAEGDIIVVSGKKARYISSEDFISYDMSDGADSTTSLNLEPCITSAIHYVTSNKTPVIYTMTGQGEQEFDSSLQRTVESGNYSFKALNLLTESKIPSDCEILMIYAPTTDISNKDLKKVRDYMKKGGKLFYVCNTESGILKNFESLLKDYGVKVNKGIVVEADTSRFMQNYPTYMLPVIESTDLTESLISNSSYILAPVSKGFTLSGNTTSLLSTTDKAYSKVNTESGTVNKEKGDISGPFSLAAEAVDSNGNPKAIVIGCASMLKNEIDNYVSGANFKFTTNCINGLAQNKDNISIKAKAVDNGKAIYSTNAQQMISIISVIGIPAIIIIAGVIVVIMRRKSK